MKIRDLSSVILVILVSSVVCEKPFAGADFETSRHSTFLCLLTIVFTNFSSPILGFLIFSVNFSSPISLL